MKLEENDLIQALSKCLDESKPFTSYDIADYHENQYQVEEWLYNKFNKGEFNKEGIFFPLGWSAATMLYQGGPKLYYKLTDVPDNKLVFEKVRKLILVRLLKYNELSPRWMIRYITAFLTQCNGKVAELPAELRSKFVSEVDNMCRDMGLNGVMPESYSIVDIARAYAECGGREMTLPLAVLAEIQ